MRAILAIMRKDLTQLVRDRAGFFFVFVFPVVFGVLFGVIFSGAGEDGPTDVPLIVVDLDGSEMAVDLVARLEADERLSILRRASREEAFADVLAQRAIAGALVIPAGYGSDAESMFFGGGAELELALDPGKQMESGLVQGRVTAAAMEGVFTSFQDAERGRRMLDRSRSALARSELNPADRLLFNALFGSMDRVFDRAEELALEEPAAGDDDASEAAQGGGGFEPVRVVVSEVERPRRAGARPRNAFEITFPQAIAWGLMSCVLGFGLLLVSERTRGTMTRLTLAPIRTHHLLAGKALGCFATCAGVQGIILVMGYAVFGVRPDSWALLALAVFCSSVAFVGLMMLFSAVGKTEAGSEGLSRAVLLVLALLGGAGVPLSVMPGWVQSFASISPFKWVITALEGAIWRGYTPGQMLAPCLVLVGIGVCGFAIGAMLFRSQES